MILMNHNEIKVNTDSQLRKKRKTMHDMNQKYEMEKKILKSQSEILEIKGSVIQIKKKNTIEKFTNKIGQVNERISDPENLKFEIKWAKIKRKYLIQRKPVKYA